MNTPFAYNPKYQAQIAATVDKALHEHKRVTAIRIDLRLPDGYTPVGFSPATITRFFEALKAKIKWDLPKKKQSWGRSVTCSLKYAWGREFGPISGKKHFHVLLLVNKDVYHSLGNFDSDTGTLAAMVCQAWCSALHLSHPANKQLVHFPRDGVMYIDANHVDFESQRHRVLVRADYLAKLATKVYGDGERSFGCSR